MCTVTNRIFNRDRNAAKNIMELFKAALISAPRPAHLAYPKKKEVVKTKVEQQPQEQCSNPTKVKRIVRI